MWRLRQITIKSLYMREPVKDPARLEHMLDAIGRIFEFVDGKAKDEIQNDSILYYAVVKKSVKQRIC